MRIGLIASGLLLAGCDLFFPLEGPALIDAPPGSVVTGRLLRHTVSNLPDLFPVVESGPLTEVTALVRFEDGTNAVIDIDSDGAFSLVRATDAYRIELLFDNNVLEIQDNLPDLTVAIGNAGRTGVVPTGLQTNFRLPVARPVGARPAIVTTGQWAQLTFAGVSTTADWRNAAATGLRQIGLLSAQSLDDVFYLEFQKNAYLTSISQEAIKAVSRFQLEMIDGAEISLPEAQVVPAPTGCARLRVEFETAAAAARNSMDPIYTTTLRNWAVQGQPTRTLPGLGLVTLAVDTPIIDNLDVDQLDIAYHDPFLGNELVALAAIGGIRPLTYPGKTSAQLGSVLQVQNRLEATLDCTTAVVLSLVAAFPTGFALAGEVMVEGAAVTIDRAAPTLLTWNTLPGEIDLYQVALLEVIPAGGGTGVTTVRSYRTRQPRVSIEPDVLVAGRYYIFQISGVRGLTNAAGGDLLTVDYPLATAHHATPMFQAM